MTDENEKVPAISKGTERRLKQRLRKAARLLERRTLTEGQYAALSLHTVFRLRGRLSESGEVVGQPVGYIHLAFEGFEALLGAQTPEGIEKAKHEYGPFTEAAAMLWRALGEPAPLLEWRMEKWDEKAQEILDEAKLRLNPLNRLKLRWEQALQRRRKHFPLLTELQQKIALLIVGALLGFLGGRLLG